MLSALMAAVITYTAFILLHWIPFRIFTVRRRTRVMTFVLLGCLPLAPVSYFWISSTIPAMIDFGPVAGSIFFGVVFILLWCGYVQFVFSFDTSPSLKVLVQLLDRPGGLSESEIKTLINFPQTFRRRFMRAVDGGAIFAVQVPGVDEDTYGLAKGSVRLARVGRAAKRLFKLGAGG